VSARTPNRSVHWRTSVVGVVAALVASACTATPAPGGVTTAPATPAVTGTPTPPAPTASAAEPDRVLPEGTTMSAVFGNPWTSNESRRHAVVRSAIEIIEAAPKGATLMLSVFNMTYPGIDDVLLRAHRRGVGVRVLVNHETATGARITRLRRILGGDTDRRSSVVVRSGDLRMHSKFLLASASGKLEHVVWMSSGNVTNASGRQQANEALTITGDARLYDFFADQFALMARGVTDPHRLARGVTTATAQVQTFPLPEGGRANDPVAALLDDIACLVDGRQTVVRLGQLFLTDERLWLAERLRELKAEGCDVRVVGYLQVWVDAPDLLTLPGPGRIDLRGSKGKALHTKITTIEGFDADGRPLKVLMAGSHNLTGRALSRTDEGVNDEFSILVWDPVTVDTYSAWVDAVIRDHSLPYAG